jgi:hypothetical protein
MIRAAMGVAEEDRETRQKLKNTELLIKKGIRLGNQPLDRKIHLSVSQE